MVIRCKKLRGNVKLIKVKTINDSVKQNLKNHSNETTAYFDEKEGSSDKNRYDEKIFRHQRIRLQ
jgi:hypothetical protein